MMKLNTDVLIVGAGPTGLALATALQKAGVDHLIVDALENAQNSSRAAVIHAHTLEMLDTIGASTNLEMNGIAVPDFVVRDRDQALLKLSFDDLPSPFRHLLMVPQTTTEAILQTQLETLGGQVHRGVSALDADRDDEGAMASVLTPDGERIVTARYIVGADGMHSKIREAAGIGFEGEAYGESLFLPMCGWTARWAPAKSLSSSPQRGWLSSPLSPTDLTASWRHWTTPPRNPLSPTSSDCWTPEA
jgi:2-polyprenyl-6-methoxyphenol hydroxylase-like FAD-dependent oxidoreductase